MVGNLIQDQWQGETAGSQFHAMDEKDRQEYKNKNPDQWVDLDGDGVLEFDPDMPPYPNYKFFTETKWESDTEGGYIGIMYVPGNGYFIINSHVVGKATVQPYGFKSIFLGVFAV